MDNMQTKSSNSWLGGMGVGAILFIFLIAVIIWNAFYKEKRADERALTAELCNTRTVLGTQSAAIQANREFLAYQVPRLDQLYTDYSYTRGRFSDGINRNTSDINRLDQAVFVSACNSGCGTYSRSGRPEFTERTTYVQSGTPTVVRRESCGSEFN